MVWGACTGLRSWIECMHCGLALRLTLQQREKGPAPGVPHLELATLTMATGPALESRQGRKLLITLLGAALNGPVSHGCCLLLQAADRPSCGPYQAHVQWLQVPGLGWTAP
jgi:hypothetical protein